MTLTKKNVLELFNSFKQTAFNYYKKGKYDLCLKYLSAACYTAYTFYLGYSDQEIENLLKEIAIRVFPGKKDTLDYTTHKNRVVFFDSFSQDTQGLTMQYLNAVIAAGYEILYITEFNLEDTRSTLIKQTLNEYSKARYIQIPNSVKGINRAQFIYDQIYNYHPGRIIIHLNPYSVIPVLVFNALPKDIIKYLINLTDQTFWIGADIIDYSFEFREYGANISIKYRHIAKERILYLPYYPVMNQNPFEGFPKEADGKIKIFSGSSYYKIIDDQDTFFKLNKAILDANPEAVILFAGGGDRNILDDLIDRYNLKGRFIPIGQRNDIFECYKHSDIYLSTYPLFGGLMSQYAAHTSLPILALNKKSGGTIEEVICQKKRMQITLPEIEDVVAEATNLIKDTEYRKKRGEEINKCVISREEFNNNFVKSIQTHKTQFKFIYDPNIKLHYLDINDKLRLMNQNKSYQAYLYYLLGYSLFFKHPQIWIEGLGSRIRHSRLGKYLK